MGRQIIKQPNGLYAVFSSVTDCIVMWDCTVDDLIEEEVNEVKERIEAGIRKTVAELDAGVKPYHQFTKDWKEALRMSKRVLDEDEYRQLSAITKPAAP